MKLDYTPLDGGLDLVTGAMAVRPGRVQQSVNFEQVFGQQGYRRIDGYERFDGRLEPHKATYSVLPFRNGTSAPSVGALISGSSASGAVLDVELDSGSWSLGTAAGQLVVAVDSGAWAAGESIALGGSSIAVADAASAMGRAATSTQHRSYLRQAVERRRSAIGKPPGSGAILGVAVYRGSVLAARASDDGMTASLWRSSAAGWVLVRAGLLPGSFEFCVANFSGDASKLALYGCNARNSPFVWDGTAFTEMDPIYGSQAKSATSAALATGSKTFALDGSSRSYQVGDFLLIYSSSTGNRMSATVTGYTHPSLTVNVTAVVGSGTYTDWRVGRADFEDAPYLLTAHRDHLYLAYPRGQLQASNTGDPLVYTDTAAVFGVGAEITGLVSLKGAVLGVFCESKVNLLEGSGPTDWAMSVHAEGIGALTRTAQENAGNALMLCGRGLASLQATQSFGSFEPAIFSRNVKPLLDQSLQSVTCARMVRGKYQYRIYLSDKTVLSACITSPNPVVQPSDVAFMASQLDHVVRCVGQGQVDTDEVMVFGTDDGWVMREDVGTSLDGGVIDAVIRLHPTHFGSPSQRKRFHKITLELDSPDAVEIFFRQVFDHSDGMYPVSPNMRSSTPGDGGQWDASTWDSFYWSLPTVSQVQANVDGVAASMGLLLWTSGDGDRPVVLQGMLTHFSMLGVMR